MDTLHPKDRIFWHQEGGVCRWASWERDPKKEKEKRIGSYQPAGKMPKWDQCGFLGSTIIQDMEVCKNFSQALEIMDQAVLHELLKIK